METEYFECQCSSPDHILRFVYDEDNDLYIDVQLRSLGFFKRLLYAFRYLFGIKHKDGAWDCTIIKNEDVPRMINFLEKVKKDA